MPEWLRPVEPHEQLGSAKIFGLEEFEGWDQERQTTEGRAKKALEIAKEHGSTMGDHHKSWVIDQMVRVAGLGESEEYKEFIKEHNGGEDGPDTYKWDKGIAP